MGLYQITSACFLDIILKIIIVKNNAGFKTSTVSKMVFTASRFFIPYTGLFGILLTNAKCFDDSLVAVEVFIFQIIE
jgi:hypothetical protein